MLHLNANVTHVRQWLILTLAIVLVPANGWAEWRWFGPDSKLGLEFGVYGGSRWHKIYPTDYPSLVGLNNLGFTAAWAAFTSGQNWEISYRSCSINTSQISDNAWVEGSSFSECGSNITTSPSMIVDRYGTITSAWANNGIYVSDKSKGEWGAADRLSQSNDFKPQLAAQEKGGLTVIWRRDYGNDVSAIMAKQKLSGVWQDELMLSELGVRATDPRLVGFSENKLVATWVEVSKDKYVIQSSIFDGLKWGQAKPIREPLNNSLR